MKRAMWSLCGGKPRTSHEWMITGLSMHHIYHDLKIEAIENWASKLDLGGFYLLGKPGRVVVEGRPRDVLEYEKQICKLRWQKCVVMVRTTHFEEERIFTDGFIEVPTDAALKEELIRRDVADVSAALCRPFRGRTPPPKQPI